MDNRLPTVLTAFSLRHTTVSHHWLNPIDAQLTGHPDPDVTVASDQGHSQSEQGSRPWLRPLRPIRISCHQQSIPCIEGDRPEISLTIHDIHLVTDAEPQDPSEVVAF